MSTGAVALIAIVFSVAVFAVEPSAELEPQAEADGFTYIKLNDREIAACRAGGGCRLITIEADIDQDKQLDRAKSAAEACRSVWRPLDRERKWL